MPTKYMTRDEAAAKIGTSVRTVDRLIADETLRSKVFRNVRKIYSTSVTTFIKKRDA